MSTVETIAAEALRGQDDVVLLDVRTHAEFRALHASPARNVPLSDLDAAALAKELAADSVYVICKAGSRSEQACRKLSAAGLKSAISVAGGTDAWVTAGLPVRRGQDAMSLERQVRIAAGLLVVIGVIGAQLWHPAVIWLSGFVGAGLVFAGITNTCGMGLLLARMPWNR
ncbi:MAG TPA: sulfurtransferase [Lentisphaeria bacterium]|jgi:rhodanese-related sulfurtransferase|nr:sulfurtransferase [Lentisphaeria bacterium]